MPAVQDHNPLSLAVRSTALMTGAAQPAHFLPALGIALAAALLLVLLQC